MTNIQWNNGKGLASEQMSHPHIYTPLIFINTDG
jgi:hypothetical protein